MGISRYELQNTALPITTIKTAENDYSLACDSMLQFGHILGRN